MVRDFKIGDRVKYIFGSRDEGIVVGDAEGWPEVRFGVARNTLTVRPSYLTLIPPATDKALELARELCAQEWWRSGNTKAAARYRDGSYDNTVALCVLAKYIRENELTRDKVREAVVAAFDSSGACLILSGSDCLGHRNTAEPFVTDLHAKLTEAGQ